MPHLVYWIENDHRLFFSGLAPGYHGKTGNNIRTTFKVFGLTKCIYSGPYKLVLVWHANMQQCPITINICDDEGKLLYIH